MERLGLKLAEKPQQPRIKQRPPRLEQLENRDLLATVDVSLSTSTVNEGSYFDFTITMSTTSGSDETIYYSFSDGTTTSSDYYDAYSSATITAGNPYVVVSVLAVDDYPDENTEDFSLTLTSATGGHTIGTSSATAYILDNDAPPTVDIEYSDTVGEGSTANLDVTLSSASGLPVTVYYSTSDGTASSSDYSGGSNYIVIPAGETTGTIPVSTTGDSLDEDDETFSVSLTSFDNASPGWNTAGTATITDDDDPPVLSFEYDHYTVPENVGSFNVTVNLSEPSGKEIQVYYSAFENSDFFHADDPEDFTGTSGTLTFAPGETSKTFSITINDDDLWESDETFSIQLSSPTNATIDDGDGTVTITEHGDNPFGQTFVCSCACNCLNGVVSSVFEAVGAMALKVGEYLSSGTPFMDLLGGLKYLTPGNPHPIITVDVPFTPAGSGTLETIEAEFTFGGLVQDPIFYDAASLSSGETYRFALQADATTLPTGQYDWVLTLTEHYSSGPDIPRTYRGQKEIVNQISNPAGNRWGVEGVDRLVIDTYGASLVLGDGNMFRFNLVGGNYVAIGDNPLQATLAWNSGLGRYVYRTLYGDERRFNSTGRLESRFDQLGNEIAYTYTDAEGDFIDDDVETITDAFGRTITYDYDAGQLVSITDHAGRVTTLTHDNGLLIEVEETDPDGSSNPEEARVTTFDYDPTTKLLTSITDADNNTTTFHYRPDRTLWKRTAPDSSYELFSPTVTAGVVDTTADSGTLGTSGNPADLVLTSSIAGSYTDQEGNTTTYTTDALGYRTSETNELGYTTTFERDARGRLLRQVDPDPDGPSTGEDPYETLYDYDADGNLLEMILPDGSVRTWTYDSTWNVPLSYEDERGLLTLYTIDSGSGLVEVIRQVVGDVDGVGNSETDDIVTTFDYTDALSLNSPPLGLPETITDPLGRVTTLEYDSFGNLIRAIYADGTTDEIELEYHYDSVTQWLEYEIDANGNRTDYTYDNLGRVRLIELPDPDGTTPFDRPEYAFNYNTLGQLTEEIDPLGRVMTYYYNSRGQLWKVERPDHDSDTNLTTSYITYDGRGLPELNTDPLGRVTNYDFDELGRLELVTLPDPDGTGSGNPLLSPTYATTYDGMNRKATETDPLGNVTSYAYSNFGRTVTITSPDPDGLGVGDPAPVTVMNYDPAGNLVSIVDALSRETTYDYDILGRLWKITQPDPDGPYGPLDEVVTAYEYDKVGNLTKITEPGGAVTVNVYNNLDRLVKIIQPDPDGPLGPLDSPELEYAYDPNGNLRYFTDARDFVTEYIYDDLDRLIEAILPDPDGGGSLASPELLYTYDLVGNLLTETDALGKSTSYEYDAHNNMIEFTGIDPDNSGSGHIPPVTEYQYDDAGQMTRAKRVISYGVHRFSYFEYDNLGRLIVRNDPHPEGPIGGPGPATSFAYDAAGNLVSETNPLGKTTDYVYDNLHRRIETQLPDPDAGGALGRPTTSFTYDLVGNMLSLTDPVSNVTSWQYDALDRVVTETNVLWYSRQFVYSQAGDLVEKTDRLGRVTEYDYDDLHRLTHEKWYDNTPSLIRTFTFDYNANGQLTDASDPAADYGYTIDGLGRRTQEVLTLTGYGSAITLDQEFNAVGLRTKSEFAFGQTGLVTQTFAYRNDYRVKQTTQYDSASQGTVTWKRAGFLYDEPGNLTYIIRRGKGVRLLFY